MTMRKHKDRRVQQQRERDLISNLKAGKGGRLAGWKNNRSHLYRFGVISGIDGAKQLAILAGCRTWTSFAQAFAHYDTGWRTNCSFMWDVVWHGLDREDERHHCRDVLRDMQRIARRAGITLGRTLKKRPGKAR